MNKNFFKYFSIITILTDFLLSQSVSERYGDRIELLGVPFKDPLVLCQILIAIFTLIVFIQSGLDKIFDRRVNLEYFKAQFKNTIFKDIYPILLTVITLFELLGGAMLVYGVYYSFAERTTLWIFYGFVHLSISTFHDFSTRFVMTCKHPSEHYKVGSCCKCLCDMTW